MNEKKNKVLKRSGIDWVVCAAGKSERFKQKKILRPKPCLKLLGVSMLERALSSLDLLPTDQLIIISRREDQIQRELGDILKKRYPWVKIHFLELTHSTRGQLETALAAQKFLRRDAGLAIWNCDTFFQSTEFLVALRTMQDVDGIIPCASAKGSAWSFVKTDKEGMATNIAEKKIISKNATVGLYYFKSTQYFITHASKLINGKKDSKEVYVSALYHELIKKGHRFKVVNCDLFLPFGTPDQVRTFWDVSIKKLIEDNSPGTIVIDLDNTLTIDDKRLSYDKKKPRLDVVRKLNESKAVGYKVIIYTARNMQTQLGDEALVIGNIGAKTMRWLEKHRIPYDGLRFGKPFAQNAFYVDDKAVRPSEFTEASYHELLELTK